MKRDNEHRTEQYYGTRTKALVLVTFVGLVLATLGSMPLAFADPTSDPLNLRDHVQANANNGVSVWASQARLAEWVAAGDMTPTIAAALILTSEAEEPNNECTGIPDSDEAVEPDANAFGCVSWFEDQVLLVPDLLPDDILLGETETLEVHLGTFSFQDAIDNCCSKDGEPKVKVKTTLTYEACDDIDGEQSANCDEVVQVAIERGINANLRIELWDRDPGRDDHIDIYNTQGRTAVLTVATDDEWSGGGCDVSFDVLCTLHGDSDDNCFGCDGDDGSLVIKVTN